MRPQRIEARRGRAIAAIAAFAALLGGGALISGCGSSATLDPVARAAVLSSKQAGVRFSLQMQLSSPQLGSGFQITGSGYASGHDGDGRMTIDLSGVPRLASITEGQASVEVVLLYPIVYMHMPFLADKLPEGKTWMKVDMAKVATQLGDGSLPQAFSLGQADPTQFLRYLRASSGQVVKLGSQQLDGVSTTHYRSSLRLSHVLDELPAEARAAARAMLRHVGESGAIPVDAWIDSQGRVRRVQLSLDISGTTASGSATIAVNFTSYGPVPPISAPPSGEVVDLTSLLSTGFGALKHG